MKPHDTLPVCDPSTLALGPSESCEAHGIVLAAGESSRYGAENKLLVQVYGEPLVAHAVRTAVDSAVERVTVVVGYQAEAVRRAVERFDVEIRENEAFAAGQSTSLACGVDAARDSGADAVVVFLGDMPYVSAGTVDLLLEVFSGTDKDAVAPAVDGKRGNPVVFDSVHFDALADVDGDVGGRELLLERADAIAVQSGDPGVLRDVDRPEHRTDSSSGE